MTQEQYNRYMDGLVLKVASKRPFGKVASFVRKHAAVDGRAQVASATALLGRKFGNRMAQHSLNVIPYNKPAVEYKDERAQAAHEIADIAKSLPLPVSQINYLENPNQVEDANEKIREIGLKSKVQAANAALNADRDTRDMTAETVKKINDSNEAIHRKEMKTPEAPSWYSKAYEWVKENPKTSLAIGGGALAGGLLLAYLMRKKEKDAKKQNATKKHKFIVGNSSLAFA